MSGPNWLLDTNVVIGLLKGHKPAVDLAENVHLDLRSIAVSQITRMELLGFRSLDASEEDHIRRFLGCCHVFLLDEQIEELAIRIRRSTGLKLPDAIISATSIIKNLTLLTLDTELLARTARYQATR